MQLFKRYCLVLAVIFTAVCVSAQNITVEIPQKARHELPQEVQSLLLVNRTVDDSYSNLSGDSLQRIFYRRRFNLDVVIHDFQAADTMLVAMNNLLFESRRYDVVIPKDCFLAHTKDSLYSHPLAQEEVKYLCETFNTDAVVSVDYFSTRVKARLGNKKYYDPFVEKTVSVLEADMEIPYAALFSVHVPQKEKEIYRDFVCDTLKWVGYGKTVFAKLTTVKQGLTEAAIAAALDFTAKIAPYWSEEQRYIFGSGDKKLKEASDFVASYKWDEAGKIWEELVAENKSKSIKSKAQFNLAVVAELQGDIELAIKKGLESYNTMYRQQTYNYLERLKRRREEIKK